MCKRADLLESSRCGEANELTDEFGAQAQAAGFAVNDKRADLGDVSTEWRQLSAGHYTPSADRNYETMCMHRNLVPIPRKQTSLCEMLDDERVNGRGIARASGSHVGSRADFSSRWFSQQSHCGSTHAVTS
jgi:hypothetical protein